MNISDHKRSNSTQKSTKICVLDYFRPTGFLLIYFVSYGKLLFSVTIFFLHLFCPHLSHTLIQFAMHKVFRFLPETFVCSLFFCHCGFYYLAKDEMKNIPSPVYVCLCVDFIYSFELFFILFLSSTKQYLCCDVIILYLFQIHSRSS